MFIHSNIAYLNKYKSIQQIIWFLSPPPHLSHLQRSCTIVVRYSAVEFRKTVIWRNKFIDLKRFAAKGKREIKVNIIPPHESIGPPFIRVGECSSTVIHSFSLVWYTKRIIKALVELIRTDTVNNNNLSLLKSVLFRGLGLLDTRR